MTIETKELVMSESLRKKVDLVCRFTCVKYELINEMITDNLMNVNTYL